jgi:hypothetical protein
MTLLSCPPGSLVSGGIRSHVLVRARHTVLLSACFCMCSGELLSRITSLLKQHVKIATLLATGSTVHLKWLIVQNNTMDNSNNVIMASEEIPASKQTRGRTNRTSVIVCVLFVVLVAVAVSVGVVVGRNKQKERQVTEAATAESSSSSLSDTANDIPTLSPSTMAPSASPMTANINSTSNSSQPTIVPIVSNAPSTVTTTTTTTVFSPTKPLTTMAPTKVTSTPTLASALTGNPGDVVAGITSNGVPYLHCINNNNNNNKNKQIILLHGASFTKETWESDDMLSKFCAGSQVVIALDLPVSTDYQGLIQVLESLKGITDTASPPLITSQPVTLVSPSASGLAMVTWIMASNDEVARLPDYISLWVPVATGSLVQATDDQIAALQNLYPHLRILAINGNDDQAGGKYSTRLADLANATAVELVGRHAVYLQSPDDFVQTILNF